MNKNNNSTKILHQQTYIQTSIPMYIRMYIVTSYVYYMYKFLSCRMGAVYVLPWAGGSIRENHDKYSWSFINKKINF